jgi:hypothetical protein
MDDVAAAAADLLSASRMVAGGAVEYFANDDTAPGLESLDDAFAPARAALTVFETQVEDPVIRASAVALFEACYWVAHAGRHPETLSDRLDGLDSARADFEAYFPPKAL